MDQVSEVSGYYSITYSKSAMFLQRKYRFINHKQKNRPDQNEYHGFYKQLVGSGQVRMKVVEGTLGRSICKSVVGLVF